MAVNMIKINALFLNSIKIDFEFDIIIYVLVFSDHDDGGEWSYTTRKYFIRAI